MKNILLRSNAAVIVLVASFADLDAQVSLGADVVSRYIWRGVDYGDSPGFQPALTYTSGSFALGTWGSYGFAGAGPVFAEHDLWASYSLPTESGTFSVLYTDYYYPSAGLKYFDYKKNGGAHVLEAGLGFAGPESFPLSLQVFYNFHCDPDKSMYVEGRYSFSTDGVAMSVFAAGTPKASAWYVTDSAALINLGLTVKKSVVVSESFSLPVFGSFIINPEIEQSYLIVGFSF